MHKILISNDDGIYGPGLRPLIKALRPLGKCVVIVPDGERSAASHSLTIHKPFRVQTLPVEIERNDVEHVYITNGTPADCIRFGVLETLKGQKVDLVIGGINHGYNLGEDIVYSGTVAIAREANMMGIPSIAVSVGQGNKYFDKASEICREIARFVLENKLPSNTFLNVNIPHNLEKDFSIEVTRLGKRIYDRKIPSGVDPRGHEFYWVAGDPPKGIPEFGTDIAAINSDKVSITPLMIDSTCNTFLSELSARVKKDQEDIAKKRTVRSKIKKQR